MLQCSYHHGQTICIVQNTLQYILLTRSFYSLFLESETTLSDKSTSVFVNPDLPKRVGIKKLSNAIKVRN